MGVFPLCRVGKFRCVGRGFPYGRMATICWSIEIVTYCRGLPFADKRQCRLSPAHYRTEIPESIETIMSATLGANAT